MEQNLEPQRPRIGTEEVRRAADILRRYHAGKRQLEQRIIDNEQFWKLRHWQQMEKERAGRQSGRSAADERLARQLHPLEARGRDGLLPGADGAARASRATARRPAKLTRHSAGDPEEKPDSSGRTRRAWWYKLKSGCAVYGVFWDAGKLGGLGDISIRRMDLLNLFWEPGVTDVQDSEHFFCTELVDDAALLRAYPQLEGKLGCGDFSVSRYLYDDRVDTSGKSLVVDWYYHTERGGRKILQYCKFVGETVLYATENDMAVPTETCVVGMDENGQPLTQEVPAGPSMAERGWYDHGRYPFVFDVLFPEEGTPAGYGYVDLCKSPQKQIDLMNQAILKNTLAAATPRFFIRADGAVNEEEYADWTRPFVHTNGNLGADSIAPIHTAGLDSVYVAILQSKIAEMKETAGNRDVTSGGTASGVTAATAIAALQEAGSKLSRNMIDDGYEAFSDVVTLCIELIRQFYSLPRQFRLLGARGRGVCELRQPRAAAAGDGRRGSQVRYRVPEFDLEVCGAGRKPLQDHGI